MKTTPLHRIAPLAAALALLSAPSAFAANVNWLGNTDANWNTGANWSAAISNNTTVFNAAGSSGTTLNNDVVGLTLTGMTFSATSAAYTINGNAITLGGNIAFTNPAAPRTATVNLDMALSATRTVTTSTNGSITLGGNLSGSGFGLTKAGNAGTLTLTGQNTFTGVLTAGGGGTSVLSVSSDANMGGAGASLVINANSTFRATETFATSKAISFANTGAQLQVSTGKTLTLDGVVSSATPSANFSGGTVVLNNGGNTFAAGTVLLINGGGTVKLGNAAALTGATLKFNAGLGLDNTSGSDMAPTGMTGLQMTGGFTFYGTNSMDLSGVEAGFVQTANSTRTITVNANTLTLAGIGASGNFSMAGGPTTGKVDGGLAKAGAGTLVIAGASTYTLGTTLSNGTLSISADNNLGTGNIAMNGAVASTLETTATFNLTKNIDFSASAGTQNIKVAAGTTLTLDGVLSGAAARQLYSGSTTAGGTAVFTNAANSATGTLLVRNSSAQISGSGTFGASTAGLQLNGVVTAVANVDLGGTTQTVGAVSFAGYSTLSNGTLSGTSYAGSNNAGAIIDVSAILADGTGASNLSMTSSGGLGKMILSGANTYTGTTTVNSGTLEVSGAGKLGAATAALSVDGGTLELGGTSQTVGAVTISGGTTQNGTLTGSSYALTNTGAISAILAGTGGLTKTGAGTAILTGNNTYTGTTTVSLGTLVINYAVASSSVVVNGGSNSGLAGSGVMANAILSGDGSVNPGNSPGILTASAANLSGGMDFNFELTALGNPTWSNATASVNDVLHLTSTSAPFESTMATAANVFNIYINMTSIANLDVLRGGVFAGTADFAAAVAGGTYNYFVLGDGGGGIAYNGNNYYTLAAFNPALSITHGTFAVTGADFAATGPVDGYVQQFDVIPEPAAWILAAFGLTTAVVFRRRRRE